MSAHTTSSPRVCVATRLHVGDMAKAPDVSKTAAFVEAAEKCATKVVVAVGVPGVPEEDALSALAALAAQVRSAAPSAEVVPVHPWGNFVPALNALVARAADCDYLLFASVEAKPTPEAVATLVGVLEAHEDALVCGAALAGHAFQTGDRNLTGTTTPWNTFALWRVRPLAVVGFPLVADGLFCPEGGGVEEVAAIECLRRVQDTAAPRAFLAKLPGGFPHWETSSFLDDPKRKAWHDRKMTSKASRAAAHLALLNGRILSPPAIAKVTHLDLTEGESVAAA
mmetsp:Transcript_6046/g.18982  ORF Transcript_6046/g.18982 Transcript_6046/m.18982 type:complete len:282 (+) Transcript_6046:36-881(+)